LLVLIVLVSIASGGAHYINQARTPTAVVQAYYDDLDFRRFNLAYARLDSQTRPSYDQYLLDLSVTGGMVASYGKLDNVRVKVLTNEPGQVTVAAETDWVTSLSRYQTTQDLTLVLRGGQWYIEPDPIDIVVPPDEFFRRGEVGWVSTGRRRVTNETTAFGDILDRPELQLLSARLVKHNDRYSVVGELINTDSDPADVTVTASLNDAKGKELSHYNAQEGMMHKLLPKEVTPFRVDFEGVAGTVLSNTLDLKKFKPDAFTPPVLEKPIDSFDVYAKGVVTQYDLNRDLTTQDLQVHIGADGVAHLTGRLLNIGTREATIPHMLITYYDEHNQVAWVDHVYIRNAVRPQRMQPFDVPITPFNQVETVLDKGDLFANNLQNEVNYDANWRERVALPKGMGYASLRVSVNYFTGSTQ